MANDLRFNNVNIVYDKNGRYNLVISDAQIMFKNFNGNEKVFNGTVINERGNRNFCVRIESEEAVQWLQNEGWNIKFTKAREGYEPAAYIPVKVKFSIFPPMVRRYSGSTMVDLNEDTVGQLDNDVVEIADLVINPSYYDGFNGKGIAAYLKTGYFTVERDPFADKYEHYGNVTEDSEAVPF